MKHTLRNFIGLLALLITFGNSLVQAQSSTLRVVNNNPSLRGLPTSSAIKNNVGDVQVTNISNQPVTVKVQRTVLSELQGSTNAVCWGIQCYPPSTVADYRTPQGDSIRPGATNTTLVAEIDPAGNEGTSRIKYCFYVNNNISDSVCTIMTFTSSVTSSKNKTSAIQMVGSPNPCTDVLNLSFMPQDEAARIDMFNLLGQKMISQAILPGTANISLRTADLPSGQYFVRFMVGNKSLGTTRVSVR